MVGKHLKKSLAVGVTAVFVGVFTAGTASAAITVVDPAAIAKIIAETKAILSEFAVTHGLQELNNKILLSNHQENIDNDNNRSANEIARTTQTMTDIANEKLKRESMPAPNACAAVSLSRNLERARCAQNAAKSGRMDKHIKDLRDGSGKDDVQRATDIEDFNLSLPAIEAAAEAAGMSADRAKDIYLKADNFLSPTGDEYSPAEADAAEKFKEIIVGPEPKIPNIEHLTGTRKEVAKMKVDTLVARYSTVLNSLDEIMKLNKPEGSNPSEMRLMQDFVNQHIGDDDSVDLQKALSGTDGNKMDCDLTTFKNSAGGDCSMTFKTQVLRSMALMEAFNMKLNLMRYKQSLRMEALMATGLAVDMAKDK